jgi:superfamily I DNA and/or RNA helicase
VAPVMLDTQFRMHPALAAFPAAHFYEGKLRSGTPVALRSFPS